MTQVNNNIKMLFKKYSEHVILDTTGGEMYLYDNSALIDPEDSFAYSLLVSYIFTGVSFDLSNEQVSMIIVNLDGDLVKYAMYKDYIYIEKSSVHNTELPIGIATFIPRLEHWVGNVFYAHFIQITE